MCVHYWDAHSGENDTFSGKGHTNSVVRLTVDDSDRLVSCSMDDTVRFTDLKKKEYRYNTTSVDQSSREISVPKAATKH